MACGICLEKTSIPVWVEKVRIKGVVGSNDDHLIP